MAAMNRREIQDIIIDGGLVPVFNHDDPVVSKGVIKACYEGGLRVFEWTNRGSKAVEIFPFLIDMIASDCPGMRIGVGSILDIPSAEQYLKMGAEFLVSPIFDPELASFAKNQKTVFIPGCGSVTEIHQAQKWGAGLVKIFPGNTLGPGFVKAVLGPMPWSLIMPTGGVSPERENLEAWFKAGVKCVGMGSQLFWKESLNEGGMVEIEEKVREVMGVIKDIRARFDIEASSAGD